MLIMDAVKKKTPAIYLGRKLPERHSSFGKGEHPAASLLERHLSYIYLNPRTIDSMKSIWGKKPKTKKDVLFKEVYEQEKKHHPSFKVFEKRMLQLEKGLSKAEINDAVKEVVQYKINQNNYYIDRKTLSPKETQKMKKENEILKNFLERKKV